MEWIRRFALQNNGWHFCQHRLTHFSASNCASVFMKRMPKLDAEIAELRERRKRRNLEKMIRELKKYSKKPKPIEELQIDVFTARNLEERRRPQEEISAETKAERKATLKAYSLSRQRLMHADDRWLKDSLQRQERALAVLKEYSPRLYERAVEPDAELITRGIRFEGPPLSPPIAGYQSPDGDYQDTTNDFLREAQINLFEGKKKSKYTSK